MTDAKKKKRRWLSVAYMFVITVVCTGVLVAVQAANQDRIDLNAKVRLQRIILDTLDIETPESPTDLEINNLFERRVKTIQKDNTTLWAGLSPDGSGVTGYGFRVSGPGFWGPITGLVAVDADLSRVLGVRFYDHSETPGLGGRIQEPWFEDQFDNLPLEPGADKRFFDLVAEGTAKQPTDLDAITGATQTSVRLEKFLNKELARYVDLLNQVKGRQG